MCASARSVLDKRRMINYAEATIIKPRLVDGSDPVNHRLYETTAKSILHEQQLGV